MWEKSVRLLSDIQRNKNEPFRKLYPRFELGVKDITFVQKEDELGLL